jgi:hypothetical protein
VKADDPIFRDATLSRRRSFKDTPLRRGGTAESRIAARLHFGAFGCK